MERTETFYNKEELERLEAQILSIRKACAELRAFSKEKGGIPFIERNVERISAPLNLLMGLSELLGLFKEQ